MEPIRVLHVVYKMHCAGIEAFIMNIYRNIDRTKVQFDFLAHYTEQQFYDDEVEKLGGKIYRLSIREDNNFIKYFRNLNQFYRNHPEYKIVHGHMESFGVFYLTIAKKHGVKVRIAHSHIAKIDPTIKGNIKNLLNKPLRYCATDLFACSEAAGKFLFGDKCFSVINNAIDVNRFVYNERVRKEMREQLDIEKNFVIGHIGRFNQQKNHTFLIDIFSKIYEKNKNAILLLIGSGDLENVIKEKVRKLQLDPVVKFLGVRKDTERLYQAMDVFVLPSLYEGLPIVGIEAQSSGLKCIFSDTVTQQTSITNNTEFIPLEASLDVWANSILRWFSGYNRVNQYDVIATAGYDVKAQAKQLEDYYLQMYKNR